MTNPLLEPCTALKKVGPQLASKLAQCGIFSIQDLLFYLPFRYQDRTHITYIMNLRPGDYAVVEGTVQSTQVKQGRRSSFICSISDGTGTVSLRFFHFHPQQQQQFTIGRRVRCFGEVRHYAGYEFVHPEYWFIHEGQPLPFTDHLTPIYHSTAGLSQAMIRQTVQQALQMVDEKNCPDYLPEEIRDRYNLMPLIPAIFFIHQPSQDTDTELLERVQHPAQKRLIFEELLAHQLSMQRLRQQMQSHRSHSLISSGHLENNLKKSLSFSLTHAQQRVVDEIKQDLIQSRPMMRLLQGDVGAGKTIVAALAACSAIEAGTQVALMVPTGILTEQHFLKLQQWFSPFDVNVVHLTGKSKAAERRETLTQLKNATAQIIVGTHALFQQDVEFSSLSLVIIDEQHRFGVHQRMSLRDKGKFSDCVPHQLIMTATPIPRTLAMMAYAELEVSVIDELPPGRTPVTTVAIDNARRDEVIERIRVASQSKRQVYWVCTLIEESEILQCQAAEATFLQLKNELPGVRIGLVHGRLKSHEKEEVMSLFKAGDVDLLIATTVIEVGVDVPNASLMIIENAERLGLSQLHQLRGRVGRGSQQSFCVLLYQSPLTQHGRERLQVIRSTTDGFAIAQHDLTLRGPGELLGTRQTGMIQHKVADIIRDQQLIPVISHVAKGLMDKPEIVEALIERWLPRGLEYGGVV